METQLMRAQLSSRSIWVYIRNINSRNHWNKSYVEILAFHSSKYYQQYWQTKSKNLENSQIISKWNPQWEFISFEFQYSRHASITWNTWPKWSEAKFQKIKDVIRVLTVTNIKAVYMVRKMWCLRYFNLPPTQIWYAT